MSRPPSHEAGPTRPARSSPPGAKMSCSRVRDNRDVNRPESLLFPATLTQFLFFLGLRAAVLAAARGADSGPPLPDRHTPAFLNTLKRERDGITPWISWPLSFSCYCLNSLAIGQREREREKTDVVHSSTFKIRRAGRCYRLEGGTGGDGLERGLENDEAHDTIASLGHFPSLVASYVVTSSTGSPVPRRSTVYQILCNISGISREYL